MPGGGHCVHVAAHSLAPAAMTSAVFRRALSQVRTSASSPARPPAQAGLHLDALERLPLHRAGLGGGGSAAAGLHLVGFAPPFAQGAEIGHGVVEAVTEGGAVHVAFHRRGGAVGDASMSF